MAPVAGLFLSKEEGLMMGIPGKLGAWDLCIKPPRCGPDEVAAADFRRSHGPITMPSTKYLYGLGRF